MTCIGRMHVIFFYPGADGGFFAAHFSQFFMVISCEFMLQFGNVFDTIGCGAADTPVISPVRRQYN